jgi:DNA-binding NtrC family response regulator
MSSRPPLSTDPLDTFDTPEIKSWDGPLRLRLIVDGAVTTHTLPESGALTMGRGRECSVRIEHPTISRVHGRIERGGDTITFTDLGSRNGSRVSGRAVAAHEPVELRVGEIVELGAVTVSLQPAPNNPPGRRIRDHDYFEGRVEEECSRATRSHEPFTVVRVWAPGREDEVEAALVGPLRAHDVLARYAPGHYEILLDADEVGAAVVSRRLVDALRGAGATVRMGLAVYGRDGHDPEQLIAAASAAVQGKPAVAAPAAPSGSAMERLRAMLARVAPAEIPVLILGETGVGKEVVARAIHDASPRASRTFLGLNCAALSETLLESEVFGHERGAFTGATTAKPGLLEAADGGTMFLDEIGEMPLVTQGKLLRVLQEREVRRVGALRARPIDVRFVAATNRDLEAEVERGRFRADLFFRLNGILLVLPPLRERLEEIEPLAREFLAAGSTARARPPDLDPAALALMLEYPWPGNIRELRNVMERALLLCDGPAIRLEHLPVDKMTARRAQSARQPPNRAPLTFPQGSDAATGEFRSLAATTDDEAPASLREHLGSVERQRIVETLERCGGNQSAAARELGISRNTLIARLAAYDIVRPRRPPPRSR